MDFYLQAPQNAQALEFDSNQANGKMRWIFGTECNIAAGHWDVWGNAQGNWISTGIPCKMPTAYKWHHLTWEFKRTASTLTYVAFTLDGVKHYVNRTYTGKRSSVNELNVAFQMDMKGNHAAYKHLAGQRKAHLLVESFWQRQFPFLTACSCRLRSRAFGPGAFFMMKIKFPFYSPYGKNIYCVPHSGNIPSATKRFRQGLFSTDMPHMERMNG